MATNKYQVHKYLKIVPFPCKICKKWPSGHHHNHQKMRVEKMRALLPWKLLVNNRTPLKFNSSNYHFSGAGWWIFRGKTALVELPGMMEPSTILFLAKVDFPTELPKKSRHFFVYSSTSLHTFRPGNMQWMKRSVVTCGSVCWFQTRGWISPGFLFISHKWRCFEA